MPLLLLIFFGLYGWIEFEVFIFGWQYGRRSGDLFGHFHHSFIGMALMKRQGASILHVGGLI